MTAPVLHIEGRVLVGPEEVRDELWVVGGKITYAAPTVAADVQTVQGWVLPGLVDAHAHVGLDAHGAVDDATSVSLVASSTAPWASSPTWACASTRPGRTQPWTVWTSAATVGAAYVILPPTTQSSSRTSSGPTSTLPSMCSTGAVMPATLPTTRDVCRAGASAGRMPCRRVGGPGSAGRGQRARVI